MKKVFLLGSSSFTGQYISERLADRFMITTCSRSGQSDVVFDVEQQPIEDLEPYLSESDVVVNCISNGDVDSCEKNPSQNRALNLDFVKSLCDQQNTHGFHLVHFSSNAVYDGEQGPYSEISPAAAVNEYGRIKAAADEHVRSSHPNSTILRPNTMYGVRLGDQRHNPFSLFYEMLTSGKEIKAVNDVYTTMLHVEDLIACVDVVITQGLTGEFNISGNESVNRYEFVNLIKRHLPTCTTPVNEVTSDQFVTPAKRPRDTAFDNARMKNTLGVVPASIDDTVASLVKTMGEVEEPLRKAS